MVDFTFAIVNWNTRDLLDACLDSIFEHSTDFSIQVLVTDNASEDGSAQMVAKKYPQVTLVQHSKNLGFARGHEPLFQLSQGRYHVLVNSDVRLFPGCLPKIKDTLDSDSSIGVLGCQIIGQDEKIQPSCRRFPSLSKQFLQASGLAKIFPKSGFFNGYHMGDFDHLSSRQVDQVMGSFFVIRRRVFRSIGILDTRFFMYYEEVDFCRRCVQNGFKVFFEAHAQVWHKGGGSAEMVKVKTIRRTLRSMRTYFRKHHGVLTYFPLVLIVSLDMVTHVVFALARLKQPWVTFKAYGLGVLDLIFCRRADR